MKTNDSINKNAFKTMCRWTQLCSKQISVRGKRIKKRSFDSIYNMCYMVWFLRFKTKIAVVKEMCVQACSRARVCAWFGRKKRLRKKFYKLFWVHVILSSIPLVFGFLWNIIHCTLRSFLFIYKFFFLIWHVLLHLAASWLLIFYKFVQFASRAFGSIVQWFDHDQPCNLIGWFYNRI